MPDAAPKSLPLILARELAANLATPMFLTDARGTLVFYNDAAALLFGRPFTEVGEVPVSDFAAALHLATPDGAPLLRRNSPGGVAFFEKRPAHQSLLATMYDGTRRHIESTSYPLIGANDEMHGVINVFWEEPGEASA